MSKRIAKWMLIANTFFLITNAIFLAIGVAPVVNFIAAVFCLGGLMASYQIYVGTNDE